MSSISKSEIDKVFGKTFRNFRIKNKLTQEQLSEKLNISLKYISRIENGNGGIKTQTLINYMNILGISPNSLFKELVQNKEIEQDIIISENIQELSKDKKQFILKMINEIKKI